MEIKYPSKYTPKDKKELRLAQLVWRLRRNYKLNNLPQKEIEICESIPGWRWEEKLYNREYEYKKLKWKIIHEFDVTEKVYRIRRLYRNNRLSNREIELCESIPNWKWQMNSFTKEDIQKILDEIKESEMEIGLYLKKNGISYYAFNYYRNKFELAKYNGHYRTKKELIDFIKKVRRSGLGITNYLEKEKISSYPFYKAIKKFNIKWDYRIAGERLFTKIEDLKKFCQEFNKSPLTFTKFCKDQKMHGEYFTRACKKFNLTTKIEYGKHIEKLYIEKNTIRKVGE